jgi:hypothetical protein
MCRVVDMNARVAPPRMTVRNQALRLLTGAETAWNLRHGHGSCTLNCDQPRTHSASYLWRIGQGRAQRAMRQICADHARAFAEKHGIPCPIGRSPGDAN